ncbi:hypothetical protein [Trichococcus ilyis]|jgi:hypothetical protein|uniref:Uncharacterized protein n=1 Tax=Trichococcus ilyis TaxID=640938 RepID=A0A143Z4B9_9LACT|nr:hypothetical protein [Trichococcus ilyis]CZR06936.1 Hypothetical protein TR210_2376 [Trichococcus ilyis]SEJ90666.1 hypothetical protein SAMN05216375_1377 [Trichococcus ilyis]
MKNSRKALLVGLGATAAIAAIAAALAYEEEAVDKISSYLNRQRMKNFVKDHLKGSQKLLRTIDDLTDDEIDGFLRVVDRAGDWKETALDLFSDLKEKAGDVKDSVGDRLHK